MYVTSKGTAMKFRKNNAFLSYKLLCRANSVRVNTFHIIICFGWNYNRLANHITGLFKQAVNQWWAPALLIGSKTQQENIFTCSKMFIYFCSQILFVHCDIYNLKISWVILIIHFILIFPLESIILSW